VAKLYRHAFAHDRGNYEMQVSTKDGQLICRHGPTLDDSTDVLQHPDFAKRRRSQVSSRHGRLPLR